MNLEKGVSDQLLVRQALSGQRESFDLLVAKYLRMVHAVAYAQTRSHTDAEDVTQETFVKAFMSLHTLRDATRIGAWLGSIARRTCHQLMAKAQGRRELEQRAGTCDAVPPADVIVEDEETAELVRRQLDGLESDEREILMLRYFAGHSVDEVAAILEIRPNTAAKRLQRAREALGERLLEMVGRSAWDDAGASRRVSQISGVIAALSPSWQIAGTAAAGSGEAAAGGSWVESVTTLVAAKAKLLAAAGALLILVGSIQLLRYGNRETEPIIPPFKTAKSTQPTNAPHPYRRAGDAVAPGLAEKGAGGGPSKPGATDFPASHSLFAGMKAGTGSMKTATSADEGKLAGWVVDEEDNPIPGAKVTLIPMDPEEQSGTGDSFGFSASGSGTVFSPFHQEGNLALEPPVPPVLAPIPKEDARPRISTLSGSDGAFLLEEIPLAGFAILRAEAEGLCAQNLQVALTHENEKRMVVLLRGIPVRGRILNAAGLPVADAEVRAHALVYSTSSPQSASAGGETLWDSCRTDERGEFTLTVKRHGSLALRVDSPSDGRASFADLPTDQSAPFDLRMPAMTAVSGKILWEDDAPATGCVVKLQAPFVQFSETVSPDGMRFGGGGAVGGTSTGLAQATIAMDGTYRIEGVEPGENFVSIADPDGTIIVRDLELGMLNPGQEHLWNYRITKPRLVRGLVRGSNSGTPLPGIVVMCENVEARSGLASPPLRATTGADGRYELRIFSSPGSYEVTPLYNRNGSMFRPTPEEAFAALVSVRTGGIDQIVDLAIPEPCTRSFRVIDTDGQPVAGCATEVHERLERGRHYWLWPDRTDANGRVVLSGLPPDAGIECLFRSPQGCGLSALYHGEAGERVPEETVVVYLPAGVSGALFDRDGSALANTEFELAVFWDSKLETRVSGVTDAAGRFQLADAAPATIAVCEFSVTMKNASNPQRLTCTSGPIEFIPNDWTDLGALVLTATGDALGR